MDEDGDGGSPTARATRATRTAGADRAPRSASDAAVVRLTPHNVASSIDELLAGATRREPFRRSDGKSGSTFDRVVIAGERYVLKTMHVDDDWIARSLGDVTCRTLAVWACGLLDALPPSIDHTIVGAARGIGRNGFRSALERRGVATDGWWDRQVGLCLLGCVVQTGWEKALGNDDELEWWADRAPRGGGVAVTTRRPPD